MEIHSLQSPQEFTLTLTKIQDSAPAAQLFLPPDGFTKYDSEVALLTELAIRERGVEGGAGGEDAGDHPSQGGQGGHRYDRGGQFETN
jgi:hypothetical protein